VEPAQCAHPLSSIALMTNRIRECVSTTTSQTPSALQPATPYCASAPQTHLGWGKGVHSTPQGVIKPPPPSPVVCTHQTRDNPAPNGSSHIRKLRPLHALHPKKTPTPSPHRCTNDKHVRANSSATRALLKGQTTYRPRRRGVVSAAAAAGVQQMVEKGEVYAACLLNTLASRTHTHARWDECTTAKQG
jgi:hypothetical protein